MQIQTRPLGEQLREWRRIRRRSQLDLALDAEVSSRHLSFVETGRSQPSREMVLRLAEALEVPLRARNTLLTAAGYAPVFGERGLDDAELAGARRAVEAVLRAHEPFPALAVDRHWNLVAANAAVAPLLARAAAHLLEPPVNVLRLSLHPDGLAPAILNLAEWRGHLLERLRRESAQAGDGELDALLAELWAYPGKDGAAGPDMGGVAIPLRLASPVGELSFLSTTTVFGTPRDVTLSELAIEAFLPADAETAERLRVLVGR